jgi:hypothetical protein
MSRRLGQAISARVSKVNAVGSAWSQLHADIATKDGFFLSQACEASVEPSDVFGPVQRATLPHLVAKSGNLKRLARLMHRTSLLAKLKLRERIMHRLPAWVGTSWITSDSTTRGPVLN